MTEQSLEQRIKLIEDELAVQKLMKTYCKRADAFDWVGWAECFTEDSLFEFHGGFGTMNGKADILEKCRGSMDHVYSSFIHYIVDIDVDVDGSDRATGTGNIIFAALTDDDKPTDYLLQGGRYKWEFARTADGWRIARTLLRFIWNNGADADSVFVPDDEKAAA
ncbi:nuclear transport factor 2 family protein [Sphingomonas profundi]|uniref:nuclear transport factor 2 family protein n=1 Tax=Alterirhizorhabdus profundi TaxID=2681549 RepID=UPI0018D0F13C|nr:nuclear transport factor 2 family protein [Sphingomonas profundi]